MPLTFFRLQVYEKVGVSLFEIRERERKSVISVGKKAQKGYQMHHIHERDEKRFWFCILFMF